MHYPSTAVLRQVARSTEFVAFACEAPDNFDSTQGAALDVKLAKTSIGFGLIGDVIGEALPSLDYEARLQALLDHRVGLWDVIANARREGSLDSRIRDHATNDLAALVAELPSLAAVAFNGGTAAKIGVLALAESRPSLDLVRLPSSSPTYAAVPYAEKLRAWEALRKWLSV